MVAQGDRTPFSELFHVFLPYYFLLAPLISLKLTIPSRVIGLAVLVGLALVGLPFIPSGDGMRDYLSGCLVLRNVFVYIYYLLLARPLEDFRHERDTTPATEMPFLKRVYWVYCMQSSCRHIGYNCQVPNVPPLPIQSRRTFAVNACLKALCYAFLLDICEAYMHLNPLFALSGRDAVSVTAQGYVLRFLNIFAWMSAIYCKFCLSYNVLAAVATGTGWGEPRYWPDLFGQWKDAYTLRRFWGRTWHQLLRQFLSAFGKATSNLLGLRSGTLASRYVQLYVAFTLSSLMHCGGDYMVAPRYFGSSFFFFFSQALAITYEDGIIWLARKAGLRQRRWTRLVGYLWVCGWFYVSSPVSINWLLEAGPGQLQTFPFSVTRTLLSAIIPGAEARIREAVFVIG